MRNQRKQKAAVDKTVLLVTFILLISGILAIADVSAPQALKTFNDSFYFVKQQALWGAIGIGALLVSSSVHYSFWKKISLPLFALSIIFLILVLLPGFGSRILGARRWLALGPVRFQPSEFVKLTLAIYLATVADAKKGLFSYLIPIALALGLIMLQPDLGTTLVVGAISFIQMFVSGVNLLYLLGAGGVTAVLGGIFIFFSDYRKERLMTYLNGVTDPLDSSYHIRQILIAIGSGGIFGVGLGHSRQKFLFLPEVATDSVFAIIAEEVGFVGSVILVAVLTFFILKIVKISAKAPDRFSLVLSAGIAAWIGGQMFLNIASMTALTPLTGIPLPFFSYGGSSLTMILFAVGIILNISRFQIEKTRSGAKSKL